MRSRLIGLCTALSLSPLLAGFSTAAQPVLFGIDSTTDGVTVVDPDTAVVTPLGPLGSPGDYPVPISIARDPTTGALYGWNNQAGVNGLIQINPVTGAGSHVDPGGPSPGQNFGALAFPPMGRCTVSTLGYT